MHTNYKTTTEKLLRYSLGSLLLFVALNAFGGGYYGMSGAEAIPLAWLEGSMLNSYFIPGLILFVCVGGPAFLAGIAVLRKHRIAGKAAFLSGLVIVGWIVVQLVIIGYVSWLQPFILLLAIIIVILALLLLKHVH
jgi:hypothetical protein